MRKRIATAVPRADDLARGGRGGFERVIQNERNVNEARA